MMARADGFRVITRAIAVKHQSTQQIGDRRST
jgi:hypothetical protein